jgi:uncharacterized cupredoxin-like copper-binding protein
VPFLEFAKKKILCIACLFITYHVAEKGGRFCLIGFHIFVLGTIGLIIIASIILMFYFKNRLTGMTGMVLAMVTGMNVGLSAGVFFGFLFQGNLYFSTIVAMLIGILAGTACGIVVGILPALEGFMAGLMGGMMGAMLGEMITQNQAIIFVNVFLTLTVSSLFLFQILPAPLEKEKAFISKGWLFKPILSFLVLASYFIVGNQLDKKLVFSKSFISQKNDHSNHNKQETPQKHGLREIEVNIHQSQYSYTPQEIIAKKGQPISLILKNNDLIDHDLEIKKIPLAEELEKHHEGHSSSSADFHLHASANKQTSLTITPTQKGTFAFYCTIPGHKEQGMTGVLIVN